VKDRRPLIGLISNKSGSLINNIFLHTTLPADQAGEEDLLSVTIVRDHDYSGEALIREVQKELETQCRLNGLTHLKTYKIPRALPQISGIKHTLSAEEVRHSDSIFLAGDYLLNGSLNAAMHSGELAAEGVLRAIAGA
jgi:hypothetical protein